MRPTRIVVSLLFAFVGLVWLGQGVGLIGGSFMTGSSFWAAMGVVLLVVAVAVAAVEYRASHPG